MSAWITAHWPAPPGVHALTTTRHGLGVSMPPFDTFNLGIRNHDDAEAVAANRAALIEALALPSPPCWLRQVHGTAVARVSADAHIEVIGDATAQIDTAGRDSGSCDPVADASVTDVPGVVLAILTADCLPVAFAADDGSEVACAHAGWRGLATGVLEATVRAMRTPPARIVAWLGPAAGPQAYEVGAEVREAFLAHDPDAASAFLPTREQHWRIDLYAIARQRLAEAGLHATRVYGGEHCTISEPKRFFSHRRATRDTGGRTGRMATLIWRAP